MGKEGDIRVTGTPISRSVIPFPNSTVIFMFDAAVKCAGFEFSLG